MELKHTMVVWNPAVAGSVEELPHGGLGRVVSDPRDRVPEVRVYDDRNQADARRFDRLGCSNGSCMFGWVEEDPMRDLFRVFLSVASDGVPLADIHREFLQIDEYAAMVGHTTYFGVEIPDEEV